MKLTSLQDLANAISLRNYLFNVLENASVPLPKDKEKRKEVLQRIERDATQLGFVFLGGIESPVQGGSGNVEYLIHLRA